MKVGSTGQGKASSQSTGLSANTVAGNVRDGNEATSNHAMKQGKGTGASAGLRGTYLAPAAGPDYHQVSAGTPGPGTGVGKNATVTSGSAPAPKGRAAPVTFVNSSMKTGQGKGARKGVLGKSFL